jgi:hypothetical protein
MSIDNVKIFCQGALGAVTFGMYHQYTSNQIMQYNNEKNEIKHRQDMKELEEKMNKRRQEEINTLKEDFQSQINSLQKRKWF